MNLGGYKLVLSAVGLISLLLIASPSISAVLKSPSGETFSELYILGPEHMSENYPYNVAVGQNYSIYVDVSDHLSSSAYYTLYVKFRNQTDPAPNATAGTPSSLPPLLEYRFLIQDGQTWQSPLTFSVAAATFSENQSFISRLEINDVVFDVNKPALWNANGGVFYYQFIFELWIYNAKTGSMEFNNRFVNLQLNLTKNI